jgi:hypothetical protein
MFTTVASSTTISWAMHRTARISQRRSYCEVSDLVIVGRDDTGLGAGDARHVAVGVGDVAEGERLGLADDAQVLVDADVASLVAAVRQRSAFEVLGVGSHAEGAKPDVGGELAAVRGGDGDWSERRGWSGGQLGDRRAQSQLDAERVELAA